jgi:DNA oxidative demethylase
MNDVPTEEQWMGRMRGVWERPLGLAYFPDFVTAPEEERLFCRLAGDSYGDVRMRGQVARRTVRHYGMSYDFEAAEIAPGGDPSVVAPGSSCSTCAP